jgi:hypothetical protein
MLPRVLVAIGNGRSLWKSMELAAIERDLRFWFLTAGLEHIRHLHQLFETLFWLFSNQFLGIDQLPSGFLFDTVGIINEIRIKSGPLLDNKQRPRRRDLSGWQENAGDKTAA